MNVKILLLFSFLFLYVITNGQTKSDFIEIRSKGYFYKNQKVNRSDLSKILKADKDTHDLLKKYRINRNVGRKMGALGVIVGTHKVLAFAHYSGEGESPDPGPRLLYFRFSGLTFIILGATFRGIGVSRFKKSIDIYNDNLSAVKKIGAKDLNLNFGFVNHGVGVSLNF